MCLLLPRPKYADAMPAAMTTHAQKRHSAPRVAARRVGVHSPGSGTPSSSTSAEEAEAPCVREAAGFVLPGGAWNPMRRATRPWGSLMPNQRTSGGLIGPRLTWFGGCHAGGCAARDTCTGRGPVSRSTMLDCTPPLLLRPAVLPGFFFFAAAAARFPPAVRLRHRDRGSSSESVPSCDKLSPSCSSSSSSNKSSWPSSSIADAGARDVDAAVDRSRGAVGSGSAIKLPFRLDAGVIAREPVSTTLLPCICAAAAWSEAACAAMASAVDIWPLGRGAADGVGVTRPPPALLLLAAFLTDVVGCQGVVPDDERVGTRPLAPPGVGSSATGGSCACAPPSRALAAIVAAWCAR